MKKHSLSLSDKKTVSIPFNSFPRPVTFCVSSGELPTDMEEKAKARLRESRNLAPSGRGGRVHVI